MKLPLLRRKSRPGPVARVKAAFTNMQALALVAVAVAVLALLVAVIR